MMKEDMKSMTAKEFYKSDICGGIRHMGQIKAEKKI